MQLFPSPVERLINQFERLPGVGRKTAQRLAFHVIALDDAAANTFAAAITEAKRRVRLCPSCLNLTDEECCPVCKNPSRDGGLLCAVAEPKDVAAIEATHEFQGLYHVLHGVISPLAGIGPEDIRVRELIDRVAAGGVREVILATNPDVEGEATALYIAKLLKPLGVKVTGLAYGIPMGGHVEFADKVTLMRAIEGRREL